MSDAPGYLILSQRDAPPEPFHCDNARCNARVSVKGDLCGGCQGRLDAGIDDLTDRGRIQRCFAETP